MPEARENITQGTLRTASGQVLPLERTEVNATIAGPVASVVVRQRFRNTGSTPIEAVYLFPLPAEASVYRMHFRIADRIVRAAVKEKQEARRIYEQAQSEGRAATLLEEDRPSLFTLSVANVAPGAVIEVELAYQEVVAYDDGHFRFVFPMVAPERYSEAPAPAPSNPGLVQSPLPPPRLPTGKRPPDVALEVHIQSSGKIDSLRCPSHLTQGMRIDDSAARVRLPPDEPIPNRDFVLTWQAAGAGVRPLLRFERAPGEPGTFLLVLTPSMPRDGAERVGGAGDLSSVRCGNCGGVVTDLSDIKQIPGLGPVLPCRYCGAVLAPGTALITRASRPRDVLVLVDRSASMRASLPQARRAVLALLAGLAPGDAAQVVAFDHDRTPFDGDGSRFVALAPEVSASVDRFLGGLAPRGGTELLGALSLATQLPTREGRTRAVVLVTDAAVGNEGLLLRRVPELLGPATRLFVLGVGPSVDRRLVARLAQAGGGAHDVLLPNEDVEITLTRFARRVREGGPVLTGLSLSWEGAAMADVYPAPLPDLFGGQPVRLLGRFDGTGPTRLVLTGATIDGKPFRQELPVTLPRESAETPGLGRLWARHRVEALGARAEREPGQAAALRAEALALALRCSLVGPFTSLVAEDSEVSVQGVRVRKLRLVVESGPDAGRSLVLDAPRRTVGRAQSADFVMSDGQVSRMHLELHAEGTGFALRDVDSANGTFIEGKRVREHRLAPGLRIRLASSVLRVEEVQGDDAWFEYVPRNRVDVPAAAPEADNEVAEDDDEVLAVARFAAPAPLASAGLPEADEALPDMARRAAPAPRAAPPLGAPPAPGFAPPPAAGFAPPPAPGFAPPPAAFAPPPPMAARPAAPPGFGPPPSPMAASFAPPMSPAPMMRASAPPAPAPMSYAQQRSPAHVPQAPIEAPGSEPYPERELLWLRDRLRGELDLVFLVDATASMGPYIEQVRARLLELVTALRAAPLCRSLRLGLVTYRDHPPQELSFVSRALPLTDDIARVHAEVQALSASGGGDGPEAVTDGLFDVVRLAWRPSAAKAVVWFGDAPPHGVEPAGDAFPGGCPCGNHWFSQAESCREMGIALYAIGCLPGLRQFTGAEAVFRTVARATRGMFLPLREAGLLVPLIAGAASCELDRQRIDEHVADLVAAHAALLTGTDEEERVRWLTGALRARRVQPRDMPGDLDLSALAPLRFRDAEPVDVEGALSRLRGLGRVAV